MKHFLTGTEFSAKELREIIDLAVSLKTGKKNVPDFSEKIATLIFANPSLRTRISFESGIKKMGGGVNVLSASDSWDLEYQEGVIMNQNKQEHIHEAAKVLSRYTDLLALRKCDLMTKLSETGASGSWEEMKKDVSIRQLAKHADVPVINMESNMFHPCQSLADMQTMVEHFGEVSQKKYVLTWAPHPKALPLATPHSQLLTPNIFGMDVTLAFPEGFLLDTDVITLAENLGGKISLEHNQEKAFHNADVVVAKSWASLEYFGKWEEEKAYRKQFSNWTVTKDKMERTNNALFMHCLPVRRNVVVMDEVLESPNSVVFDEAENRMWSQIALMSKLFSFPKGS
jgi:N-acetylornithine carbamoyltransferase